MTNIQLHLPIFESETPLGHKVYNLIDALTVLNAFKCINTIWPFFAMPYCQNPSSGDIKVTFLVEGFLFIFSYRYVGGEKLFFK